MSCHIWHWPIKSPLVEMPELYGRKEDQPVVFYDQHLSKVKKEITSSKIPAFWCRVHQLSRMCAYLKMKERNIDNQNGLGAYIFSWLIFLSGWLLYRLSSGLQHSHHFLVIQQIFADSNQTVLYKGKRMLVIINFSGLDCWLFSMSSKQNLHTLRFLMIQHSVKLNQSPGNNNLLLNRG